MEEEVREAFTRRFRKYFTGVSPFFGKKRILVRFQYGFKKELISNQLTAVAVERMPETEESTVPTVYVIPVDMVILDKGYYHGVSVLL